MLLLRVKGLSLAAVAAELQARHEAANRRSDPREP